MVKIEIHQKFTDQRLTTDPSSDGFHTLESMENQRALLFLSIPLHQ